MADTYGRLTGMAGVCLATPGPGATNLITGLADANMDRSPVVAIIGQGSTRLLQKESHQNLDAISIMKPISKWAYSVYTAQPIPEIVPKGFKIAEAKKPGVTVIELPEDVAKRDTDEQPMLVAPMRRPAADHKAVSRGVDLITNAKSPVILAGNGSVWKRAATQLRHLARETSIPVVNTFMGKGAVPMNDPHTLFTMRL